MSAGRRTRAVTNDVAVEDSTYTSGRRGIAGTVFVHKICGAAADGGRGLGPRIAHAVLPIPGKGGNDWRYSWIPVIGPIIGGILGATLYNVLGFGS